MAGEQFDPSYDAERLRAAMKGWGTNDEVLVHILTTRTHEQLQEVRATYAAEIERDLVEDIKSETSGDYRRACVGALLTKHEFDATMLHEAMKGMGTDEAAMIQILAHASLEDIDAIKEKFKEMFGESLKNDIKGDTSGYTEKFFLGLIDFKRDEGDEDEIERDIMELYHSGPAQWGTDENSFIKILTKHDNAYVSALNVAYARKFGKSLASVVKSEMSGWLYEGIRAMLTPCDQYFANIIFKAMDGMGTDDTTLIRILASQRENLVAINDKFINMYDVNLKHRVQEEVGGDYAKILLGNILREC